MLLLGIGGPARAADDQPPTSLPWYFDANAKALYRFETIQGGDQDGRYDHTYQQYFTFYGNKTIDKRSYSASIFGRYDAPVYNIESSSFFRNVEDSRDTDQFKLYQGYLDLTNPVGPDFFGVRLGRQDYIGAVPVRFDGGNIYMQDPGNHYVRANFFIGQYVSFFDNAGQQWYPYGGGLSIKPYVPGMELYASSVTLFDTNWTAGIRQRFGPYADAQAEYGSINSEPDNLNAQAGFHILDSDSNILLSYYNKLKPVGTENKVDDYLYDYTTNQGYGLTNDEHRLKFLFFTPIRPYAEYEAIFEQGLAGGKFVPGIGFMRHQLASSADEDYYNYTYNRYEAFLTINNPWIVEFNAKLNYQYLDDQKNKSEENGKYNTIGGNITKGFFKSKLDLYANALYRTYDYLNYTNHAASYNAGVNWEPCNFWSASAAYELEYDDWYQKMIGMNRVDRVTATMKLGF